MTGTSSDSDNMTSVSPRRSTAASLLLGTELREETNLDDGWAQQSSNPSHESVVINMASSINQPQASTQGLDIKFRNVKVTVPDVGGGKKAQKTIIHGISGHIEKGSMIALMGATGSGKSTMLSALANRLEGGAALDKESEIRYGPYSWEKSLRSKIGFVEQDDIVISELTVRQSLMFQARLRLGNLSREKQIARVDHVVKQLRLQRCENTIVGDALDRGISGGERKRLCIGMELLVQPLLFFLDEPTSGLDSRTATLLVECLQELTLEGVTVIASIHQPSSQVYSNFSHLCFLHDGNCIFFGDRGEASINYFAAQGFHCPVHFNPPDYFMEVAVGGKVTPKMIAKAKSDFGADKVVIKKATTTRHKETTSSRYSASYKTQLAVLAERSFIKVKAQKLNWATFALIFGLAVLNGCLFFDLPTNDKGIFPRFSMGLWIVGTWMFFPIINAGFVFGPERVTTRKELYVGAYRLSAYYIARIGVLIPFDMLYAWMFTTIVYVMSVPRDASFEQYVYLILATWLSMITYTSIGLAVATAIPGQHIMTVSILLITFSFAFTGFFIPFPNMSEWLRWTEHANMLVYSYQMIEHIVYELGPAFPCIDDIDFTEFSNECNNTIYNTTTNLGVVSQSEALEHFGINKDMGLCVGILIGVSFCLNIFAYRALRFSFH
eukprot:m.125735 g.125735  ORF g.125735 m.125735 type:complete len:667 (-) comp29148_c0_seq1:198-2198(-)